MQYSGLKTLPGKKRFMCQEELRKLVFDSKIDSYIAEKNITLIFNLSITTQIEELESSRVFEMHYVEMLEVLSRLAEYVSLPSLYFFDEETVIYILFINKFLE